MASTLVGEIGLGLLRTVLMAVGGGLVTDGLITNAQLGTAVGGMLAVAGVIAQVISSRNHAKASAVVTAVEAHPNLTIIPANQAVSGKPKVIINTALRDAIPPRSLTQP